MKSLSQTINEKLKIRKSTSNIKRFELYSEVYNDDYLNEFLVYTNSGEIRIEKLEKALLEEETQIVQQGLIWLVTGFSD